MAIVKSDSSTGVSKTSSAKKIIGYFNLDWVFKVKGEKQTKRLGGISHWGKDPMIHHLFELLEANPDQEITIKLSVKRNAAEIDVSTIEL